MAARAMSVVIVGGHGNVSMRLSRLLTSRPSTTVHSIFRDESHIPDVSATGAKPIVLSIEDASTSDFSSIFKQTKADVVYFSAGSGGKGGPERTMKVDRDGAIKIFDAIEEVEEEKRPRLVMVSAIDVRDPEKVPEHYTEEDLNQSKQTRSAIGTYMTAKYEADKNLAKRATFKWTILRPGGLSNEPGTGKATIGKAHLTGAISRDDVAKALYLLLERDDAAGLGIDFNGGNKPIEDELDRFIRDGRSDFLG